MREYPQRDRGMLPANKILCFKRDFMGNLVYENQKINLEHSKNEIDRAACCIRHGCEGKEREQAIAKIQNYREIHLYPLMLIKNHLARTANKVDPEIIIARRLKRLPTIIHKLERNTLDGVNDNSIKLTRMQDIGGCRAIVKDLSSLRELQARLLKSRSVHKIIRTSDYLTPKATGYGGVHLVYSCFHDDTTPNHWKKTKIEVQLRTSLQHAWATSLEIIDTLEHIDLKTSLDGHEEWRRFFYVAGVLVAHDEGADTLENEKLKEFESELYKLELELNVLQKLLTFSVGIKATESDKQVLNPRHNFGMCLITINKNEIVIKNNKVKLEATVSAFKSSQAQLALESLNASENNPDIYLSVLLSTSDIRNLKKAYPNYFGSTSDFRKFIIKHTRHLRPKT